MRPFRFITELADDLLSLVYPQQCLGCGDTLVRGEDIICLSCRYHLPETGFHKDPENTVFRLFWGRAKVEHATSLFFFAKGTRIQHLMHQLKYRGHPEVGVLLGQYYGHQLKDCPPYNSVDCIVPVPLHPRKQHKRGYNQSAKFAQGLADTMNVPAWHGAMVRTSYTDTQTKKSRIERVDNVERVFDVAWTNKLTGKHVLLVDDVVTTGATLEACANILLELPGTRVSLATIATAFNF